MICLFGGTFDPVHNGHLHAARAAADALGADEVRMVLAARPHHKDQPLASIGQRWEMLQSACETDARLVADDVEMRLSGPSYTVDTLAEVRARHAQETVFWVIGTDTFRDLRSWYRWQDLLDLTHLAVLQRPRSTLDPDMQAVYERFRVDDVPQSPAGSILRLETAMLDISATEVRQRIATGASVEHLLPDVVCTYIRTHGLYLEANERAED